ncbi:transposable element Tc3 transposase [Trichonephila clavipes]|nr:transposable element Tc3 transposase [Trichonephila clavipes]
MEIKAWINRKIDILDCIRLYGASDKLFHLRSSERSHSSDTSQRKKKDPGTTNLLVPHRGRCLGTRGGVCQVIYSQFGLAIHKNDHQIRRRFVEWAQNEIAVVPDFQKRNLYSDEAHFWLNAYANKQNCRIWSEANPQVYVETPLHQEKLTVWCALWAARATIDLLKDTFGDRLISRFGPVNWPPRSCDLTPLDYFLWGYVKSLVYADKPQTLDHLEDNIRRVIADIRPQMLENVIENWTSRLDYIRASRGSPMPEIIFEM